MYDYIMYVMSNIWYTVYITQRNNIYLRAAAPAADPGKKCAMRSQGSKSADAWGAVVFQGQLNENKYQLFLGASHFYAARHPKTPPNFVPKRRPKMHGKNV